MEAKHKYHNRAQELEKLVKVLRDTGISNVEQLTPVFEELVKGYVAQLHMKMLTKYELEYVWLKLLD
jgi:16S rRNA C1402 (ribose-2'-O) methylase RsmI